MMKVVFRVDASQWIGSGHVMRCLVLANALENIGWGVEFACIAQVGDLIAFIEQKGYIVKQLSAPLRLKIPRFDGDYESWLHRTECEDARDFINKAKETDWVVVDHYGIGCEWERIVKHELSCRVLSLDDLARKHESNIILDQNLYSNMAYRYAMTASEKLLGPKYALLRRSFRMLRLSPPKKQNQLLAFFGGSDLTNECEKLLKAVSTMAKLPFKIKLVTGKQNACHERLLKYEQVEYIEIVKHLDNFELELAKSKYAIGASGVCNWERFCLNIPSTIVSVADNQNELSQHLATNNYVAFLGHGNNTTLKSYQKEFERLTKSWNDLVPFQYIEVDGLGVDRVIKVLGAYN